MAERNEPIFADSNYFVALFNDRDALTGKADIVSKVLDEYGTTLVISNFVFLEIVTITSMKTGKEVAVEAGRSLLSNPRIRIIHIDEELQEESWRIFQQIRAKNISFTDCSIIAVMRAEGISTLLTFDETDFRRLQEPYGFKLYGE